MDERRVDLGDWVVLESSDGKRVLAKVTGNAKARFGREKRNIGSLVGARWGSLFYAGGGNKLVVCREQDIAVEEDSGGVDNRKLRDTTSNQRLTERDITLLKRNATSGAQVVNHVAANSDTFQTKTRFSQEKYLKRKREKFDLRVRVVRPTAHVLCATYFARSPEKICHMRPDSLALVLGYGGVVPRRHVLVVDQTVGLLTGAVVERLGGYGRVLNIFSGTTPPSAEVLKMLNLPSTMMETVVNTPMDLVNAVDTHEDADEAAIRYVGADQPQVVDAQAVNGIRAEAIAKRPRRGLVKQWLKDGFDSLVMAVQDQSVELMDVLMKHLAPSGTFAVYCTHLQEAADLQYALQMSKLAIRVELIESMLLHHQVLPGRSHPAMTDRATGGYVVSGVRIHLPDDNEAKNTKESQ